MNLWERITGSDLSRDWRAFEARADALPDDYQPAWRRIRERLMLHSDFTGRNLTPVVDGVLGLLETTAVDGQGVQEVLGEDVEAFVDAVVGADGTKGFRDKWREQLNRDVARKLSRLEG